MKVEEGSGRSPPQRVEIGGKVKILADLVAESLQNTDGQSLQYLQRKLLDSD